MKGRYYQALTDDPMVDVLADQDSLREMSEPDVFQQLAALGINKDRLTSAMDSNDNWGSLVHAFEYVTAISVLIDCWPDPVPPRAHPTPTGKFPMHEGGR